MTAILSSKSADVACVLSGHPWRMWAKPSVTNGRFYQVRECSGCGLWERREVVTSENPTSGEQDG